MKVFNSYLILILFLLSLHLNLFSLQVYGDVIPGTHINTLNEFKSLINQYDSQKILICGDNNIGVLIKPEMLKLINWSDKKGQISFSSDELPPVCSIKNIKYISIDSKESPYAISLIDSVFQKDFIKPFDYILSQSSLLGQSEKNGHIASKYQIPDQFKPQFIQKDKKQLLITNQGNEIISNPNIQIEFKMTHFSSNQDTILCVWTDYPETGLRDIYLKQKEITENQNTLAIFIDGLGWHLLENYCAVNNLQKQQLITSKYHQFSDFLPTRSVYPSRTQYAYYMLGSGKYYSKSPDSRIYNEKVFKNGLIIEEEKCYYPSLTEIQLNTDDNDNGIKDDEIFYQAMKAVKKKKHPFILVHFHSVDDMMHEFGPYHPITMNQLSKVFDYSNQLINAFKGQIIIFSDHGGHAVLNNGGTHGSVKAEDMTGVLKYVKTN